MSWIPVNDKLPTSGKKLKVLCHLETEATYEPKDGVDWHHIENAPMKATATHWFVETTPEAV